MPPKRKRAEATTPADAPAKATRSSTRGKATAKDADEGTRASVASNGSEQGRGNGVAAKGGSATEVAPPTKKPRTTKAAASKEKSSKATITKGRGSKFKKAAASEADENVTDGTAKTQKSSPEAKAVVPAQLPVEPYTPQAAERLFESYADEDDPTVIGAEGFERLFTEAQIPMDGAMPLILAWQLGETEMAKITKGNWGKAMAELQICSLVPLALALNELYDLLILSKPPIPQTAEKKSEPYSRKRYWAYARDSNKAFRELYAFCYKLATQPGSRNIEMETALTLWTVILAPNQPIINGVVEFANEAGSYKAVNKDLWSMMLEFCTTIKPDLSDFETDGAWPTMIDDFVNWKKAKDRPLGEQPIDV